MKALTLASTATLALAVPEGTFIDGLQKGVFVGRPDQFENFNCDMPEPSEKLGQDLGMYNMAKGFMGGS